MKVKFINNPYMKVSRREVKHVMTDLATTFFSESKHIKIDLLKEARKVLYKLGWSLEEFQDTHKSRRRNEK